MATITFKSKMGDVDLRLFNNQHLDMIKDLKIIEEWLENLINIYDENPSLLFFNSQIGISQKVFKFDESVKKLSKNRKDIIISDVKETHSSILRYYICIISMLRDDIINELNSYAKNNFK
jgi:hypothetical protein